MCLQNDQNCTCQLRYEAHVLARSTEHILKPPLCSPNGQTRWQNSHGCGGAGGGASISGSPAGLHAEGGGTAILRNITIDSPHNVCRPDDR
jgi:hypothetical protein